MVAGDGVEPSLTVSETAVLPLDDPATKIKFLLQGNYAISDGELPFRSQICKTVLPSLHPLYLNKLRSKSICKVDSFLYISRRSPRYVLLFAFLNLQ